MVYFSLPAEGSSAGFRMDKVQIKLFGSVVIVY